MLLRRLPIERMAKADIPLAFAALAAHLGRATPNPALLRGADCEIPLGTGTADLTALLCVSEPQAGFALRLASAVAVHNTLACEEPASLAKHYLGPAPAFATRGSKLFGHLCPRTPSHAPLLARAEAAALTIDFEPGDVLLLNNHHAVFGLKSRGSSGHGTFGSGGRLLHLGLESGLVAARPVPDKSPPLHGPWAAGDAEESQAAA